MKKRFLRITLRITVIACITYSVIGGSVEAWAERRVALVVGNASYKVAGISLPNPRNDAEDVSNVLKTLGFEVVTTINANKRDMDLALQRFARLATDADSALFFYAGHALQFQGRNFLMPTDAELEDEISVRYQAVSMEDVRSALDRANGVKIMILDACRNNPLADGLQKKIAGASRAVGATTRGLARVDKTQGMVVAYATAADDVAQDGSGRNSPFTTALLKRMQEPGLEIEMMFRRVAADVNTQTAGKQRPETYISLLSEYYLNQSDRILWDSTDKDNVAALREFINKYPSSPHAIFARNRLELLERFAQERVETARREKEARDAEEQRRKADAEAQKKREAEAEAQRKQAEADAQRKREAETEAQRKQAEAAAETQRKREAEAEAKRKLAEADAQKKREAEAEAQRKQAEADAQRKREAEAEAQRKLAEAAESQRKREAEAEAKRKQAEADGQKKREAEAEAQRKQAEADVQRKREAEAEAQRRQAEAAEAQRKREAEAEAKRKQAEADAQKKREAEAEAQRKQAEADAQRKREAEAEAQRKQDDQKRQEALRRQQQEDLEAERQRLAALDPQRHDVPAAPVQPAPGPDVHAVKANLPEQIKQAQLELRRLGCFAGAPDGALALNDKTRNAIKDFWSKANKPVVEISITDEFIADLGQHPADFCIAAKPPKPAPPVAHTPRKENKDVATRPAPTVQPQRVERAPAQAAPREAPPPAKATAGNALGTGF